MSDKPLTYEQIWGVPEPDNVTSHKGTNVQEGRSPNISVPIDYGFDMESRNELDNRIVRPNRGDLKYL